MPGESSLLPRQPACRVRAAGLELRQVLESWLNFPFSWGMWGKGLLDALELLGSNWNLPGVRASEFCGAQSKVLPPFLPSIFLPLPPSFLILLLDEFLLNT